MNKTTGLDTFKLIIELGADVNYIDKNYSFWNPLMMYLKCTMTLSPLIVKLLVDAGTEINHLSSEGCNGLFFLFDWKYYITSNRKLFFETADILIAAGIDVNAEGAKNFPTNVLMWGLKGNLKQNND